MVAGASDSETMNRAGDVSGSSDVIELGIVKTRRGLLEIAGAGVAAGAAVVEDVGVVAGATAVVVGAKHIEAALFKVKPGLHAHVHALLLTGMPAVM